MLVGIIFTIITGLFFLLGIIFLNNYKNKANISLFATSLAFVVIISLLAFDLLPEIIEAKNIYLIIPLVLGFGIFIVLDRLIPHHHHEHHEHDDDEEDHLLHMQHIGVITIIALTLHNLLEGLTLYSVTINNITSGLFLMLSISLHNIPLGLQVGNSLKKQKYHILLTVLLVISSFLGALVVIIFGNINELTSTILLSLTFGMLLYILIFELFGEIKSSLKKKSTIYGIIVGVIILILSLLIEV